MTGLVLQASALVRRFGSRDVVDGATLSLHAGETTALVGTSGCGKTTLLQLLGLLDPPDGGTVDLGGVEPWSLAPSQRDELRLQHIGFVFQNHNLIDHLSARDNVALPAWRLDGTRRSAVAKADRLLERLGLEGRRGALAGELSTGEAQRVAVARALVNRPRIVLADEPTGSLDSGSTERLLSDLQTLAAEGVALLVATHDQGLARRLDRIVHMRDGRVSG